MMTAVTEGLRRRLNQLRHNHRTLDDFAREVGVPRRSLERWLNEGSTPNADSLARIAETQKVSLDWLLFGREERVLQSEDELADQLWQRVRRQLLDEGARPELAEMAIPAPDDLLHEVLGTYRGRGRGLGANSSMALGAALVLTGDENAARELDRECDALEQQMGRLRNMYLSLDALRMRLALDGGNRRKRVP